MYCERILGKQKMQDGRESPASATPTSDVAGPALAEESEI